MDRTSVLSAKRRARNSRGARRLARQFADILTPRDIVFEKIPEDTLEAAYFEVPLKPGQLSGPMNMFSVLSKVEEEEAAAEEASDDDDGEPAVDDDDDDSEPAAGDDDGEPAADDDDEEAAAAEGDDDEAATGDHDEA